MSQANSPAPKNIKSAEWLTASTLLQAYVSFLLSRAGAVFIGLLCLALIAASFPKLAWGDFVAIPFTVIGLHFLALTIGVVGAAVGDYWAGWIMKKMFGARLSPANWLHRILYFLMTLITLPAGIIFALSGDMP